MGQVHEQDCRPQNMVGRFSADMPLKLLLVISEVLLEWQHLASRLVLNFGFHRQYTHFTIRQCSPWHRCCWAQSTSFVRPDS